MRVALAHGTGRLESLEAALTERGHEVVREPLIEVRPRTDAATRSAAEALTALPWLLFTSRSAVEAWQGLEAGFGRASLGAVGEATAAALERAGGRVRVLGEPPTGRGLARAFLARRDARGPVGLPQGDRARPTLRLALVAAGVPVRPLVVYETHTLAPNGGIAADAVVLASTSAVSALPDDVAARAALVAIGPTTARALTERGFTPRVAARPDADAILDEIEALAAVRRTP